MLKKILSFVILAFLMTEIFSISISATDSKKIFSKNVSETKKIALTFDDGPHPRYTGRILDLLKKYNVRATFFLIGENIENYPENIKRIHNEGHEIGNHSYSHTSEQNMDSVLAKTEIERCEALIKEKTGILPKLFRPPQGKYSHSIEKTAFEKGYSIILWSIDTKDWAHNSPQNILKTVKENVSGGDIILMHDYISGKNTTCDALELIIPFLIEEGYHFVTVSELIENN